MTQVTVKRNKQKSPTLVTCNQTKIGNWYMVVEAPLDSFIGKIGVSTIDNNFGHVLIFIDRQQLSNEMYKLKELKSVEIKVEE